MRAAFSATLIAYFVILLIGKSNGGGAILAVAAVSIGLIAVALDYRRITDKK